MKHLQHMHDLYSNLADLAELLAGVVDGRFIRCASPGFPAEDRSCWISMSPSDPAGFYVYDCIGSRGRAAEAVRQRLGVLRFKSKSDNAEGARREWGNSLPARYTVVEKYLNSRSITQVPSTIRYHPSRWHSREYSGPAMIAGVTSLSGEITGLHQTWLNLSGTGKAALPEPRKTLGQIRAGAIRLGPISEKLALAEGIETALSFMQASGISTWSALSAPGLRTVELPLEVRHVIIAADGDSTGEAAAYSAAMRFRREGRRAEIAQAPRGKDFNSLLQEASR